MKKKKNEKNIKKGFWRGFSGLYGVLFALISLVVLFLLILGGILFYQTYGISDETNWDEKDEIELEQEENADSVVNSVDIFD